MGRLMSFFAKLLFTDDCLREYKSRRLLFYYCFSGGFCFDKRFKRSFRMAWMAYNVVSTLTASVCCACYLMDLVVRDFRTVTLGVLILQFMWLKVAFFLLLFYYRQTFDRVIDLLIKNVDANFRKNNGPVLNPTYWMIALLIMFAISGGIGFVQDINECFNLDSKITVKEYYMYLYPISWPFENYWSIEFGIRALQWGTILPNVVFTIANLNFMFTAFVELYNNFSSKCLHFREISESTFDEMEKLTKAESQVDEINSRLGRKYEYKRLKKAKDEEMATFLECYKEYVVQIQELTKVQNEMTACFKIYVSLTSLSVFSGFFFLGSFLATLTLRDNITLQLPLSLVIAILMCLMIGWNLYTGGHLVKEMNEMVAGEVYSSPWYLLAPNDRKMVCIFLSMLQQPRVIRVLKIFPVTLDYLPTILDSIYSNVQITRTLQLKYYS